MKPFKHWITGIGLVFCCILLSGLLLCSTTSFTDSAIAKTPRRAPLGIFLTQLGGFDLQKKSFTATFWLWTQTAKDEKSILDSIEFPNAIAVKVDDNVIAARKSKQWIQRRVIGTFAHDWDMRNFPFDYQTLVITLEEGGLDGNELRYLVDKDNSSIDIDIKLDGWEIKRYFVEEVNKQYRSNFGDPNLPANSSSEYTRMELKIELHRKDLNGFFKLTAGAFAAAGLAFASYFLHANSAITVGPQFSLLAGSMFAVVISLRSASNELGSISYLTLVDLIHLAIILYILITAGVDLFILWHFQSHNNQIVARNIGARAAVLNTLGLCGLIIAIIYGSTR